MTAAVEVDGLVKTFGDIRTLDGLPRRVEAGTIRGINMLTMLAVRRPPSGRSGHEVHEYRISGIDPTTGCEPRTTRPFRSSIISFCIDTHTKCMRPVPGEIGFASRRPPAGDPVNKMSFHIIVQCGRLVDIDRRENATTISDTNKTAFIQSVAPKKTREHPDIGQISLLIRRTGGPLFNVSSHQKL